MTPEELIHAAREAGMVASEYKLNELRAAGPKYSVHSTGFGEAQTRENMVGTMLDLCGGAFIIIDNARTAKFRELKAWHEKNYKRQRDFTDAGYDPYDNRPFSMSAVLRHTGKAPDTRWSLRRDDYRQRYVLSIYDMNNRQEMSVNEAAARAAAEVVRAWGLPCHVDTYID